MLLNRSWFYGGKSLQLAGDKPGQQYAQPINSMRCFGCLHCDARCGARRDAEAHWTSLRRDGNRHSFGNEVVREPHRTRRLVRRTSSSARSIRFRSKQAHERNLRVSPYRFMRICDRVLLHLFLSAIRVD